MKREYAYLLLIVLLLGSHWAKAQAPKRYNAAELHESIKKLNFLGSALYVAAHPDDENTRMIAYLANVLHARTAYLSMTRGDGGQNLVGPEIREQLGLIRTHELLAARRTDGGSQLFTRANDFGYSKHPDETFAIWNKEEVLGDVVWAMRKWQPDIVINRFDHRSPGSTHGHHTGSAMLSTEAFQLVGDPTAYPAQLRFVNTWQPKRLFFNTSWWFYGGREEFAKADKSKLATVDVGHYLPKLGLSVSEIAALSRSQHKSQGFGSSGSRGRNIEYLELLEGDMPADKENLFEGINTTWTRVKGGAPIGELLTKVAADFNFDNPSASVPDLLEAHRMIKALPQSYWQQVKQEEIEEVIVAALGLYLEARVNDPTATPGEMLEVSLEAINRSEVEVQLHAFRTTPSYSDSTLDLSLTAHEDYSWEQMVSIPADAAYSNPYWLNETGTLGMYKVEDQLLRGRPETPPAIQFHFDVHMRAKPSDDWTCITIARPLVYQTTDPVKGEVYEPFVITPPVFVGLDSKNYVFATADAQDIKVKITAGTDQQKGTLKLAHPQGWTIEPNAYDFELNRKGEEQVFSFRLSPPAQQEEGLITPFALIDGQDYHQELTLIDYDHIPTQRLLTDASTKVVRLDLKRKGQRIGYLPGAGDDIPAALEQIGYQVDVLEDKDFSEDNLARFDAILLGVRAYNTVERINVYQPRLLDYVKNGGTLVIQYNTGHRLQIPMAEVAPYTMNISRDRVTDETAPVRFLAPDHPVLNTPNKITQDDFAGWVQERGLYFPNEWGEEFTPILSSNDAGEPARDGGLLVAPYGKGWYVYSGYSWFRELPAGVPGAFRILTNLLSLGN